MHWQIELAPTATFPDWQPLARHLLHSAVPPEAVSWQPPDRDSLFSVSGQTLAPADLPAGARHPGGVKAGVRVPRAFLALATHAAAHQDPQRFGALYLLLWRLTHGERHLLQCPTDPLVRRVQQWAKAVSRDIHKMKAFVRFRKLELKPAMGDDSPPQTLFVAWFEPRHYSLPLAADFFTGRFHNMDWSILTPYLSMHWQHRQLRFGAGCDREQAPDSDRMEDFWRTYYRHIFNPARLKVKAMCAEMPQRYWHNLPEAELIEPLISGADAATGHMLTQPTHAAGRLPAQTRFQRQQWLQQRLPATTSGTDERDSG
ncbi:MAG: hypothetical protein CML06_07475 [Pseudomonadales bacterium]|nr:hypothetical protein [Pseudomonadales bacterium]